jgi:hypothetical protein
MILPVGDPAEDPEPTPARDGSVEDERDDEMKVEVVCYSGYKGDERPVRFRLRDQEYFVEELLSTVAWTVPTPGPNTFYVSVISEPGPLRLPGNPPEVLGVGLGTYINLAGKQ